MQNLSFIHVSDLHLDNFPPVKQEHDEIAVSLHEAPYKALDNLLALCREKSPQFIVYSGDIHEHGVLSLKARFHLTEFFGALKELSIPFYYACGNHDHLGQNDAFFGSFDNVYRFGQTWSSFTYPPRSAEAPLCRIYGVSHSIRKETKNFLKELALGPNTAPSAAKLENNAKAALPTDDAPFGIGVLHATVNSSDKIKNTDKHVVGLCKEADFAPFPIDYWALGHIHEPSVLQENPMLMYAGAMQATRMSETGLHGAVLVTVKNVQDKQNQSVHTAFHPLAPLEVYAFTLPLAGEAAEELENADQCMEYFLYYFKKEYARLEKNPLCTERVFTLFIDGQHELYKELGQEPFTEQLKAKLEALDMDTKIRIRKIKSTLRPKFGYENARKREDLLGEVFRVLEDMRQDPELFESIFKKIENEFKIKNDIELGFFEHSDKRSKKQLEKYKESLLKACENICVNMLEPK